MKGHKFFVREMNESDVESITDYWMNSENSFRRGMGMDLKKLPTRVELKRSLKKQLKTHIEKKNSYCVIWELDDQPVGHSNVNPVFYGEEGFMHLHIWKSEFRKKGFGSIFLKLSLPYFFESLKLKTLYCEPYALNQAPDNTLKRAGFVFLHEYITTPGSLSFEQPVKKWEMTYEKYKEVISGDLPDKAREHSGNKGFYQGSVRN